MAALAAALRSPECCLELLVVQEYQFADDGWEDFCDALANATPLLLYVYAVECALDAHAVAALVDAMRANATLKTLHLDDVDCSDVPADVLDELRADPRVVLDAIADKNDDE